MMWTYNLPVGRVGVKRRLTSQQHATATMHYKRDSNALQGRSHQNSRWTSYFLALVRTCIDDDTQQTTWRNIIARVKGPISKCESTDMFPSVHWHYWLGDRKDIRPIKNWCHLCKRFCSRTCRGRKPAKKRLTQVHLENGLCFPAVLWCCWLWDRNGID